MTTTVPLLQGDIALVTGAGSGIGAAVARGLAAHGARVVAVGTTLNKVRETQQAIEAEGGQAWSYLLDVREREQCRALAARVASEVGPVSVLVNNAGVIRYAALDEADVDQAWEDVIETNLSGPFHMVRALLGQLKATRGRVINLSSIAASIYTHNTVGYSASKGGVRSLTVAMARELGGHGIRVNAIAPGAVATGMSPSAQDPVKLAALARRVPLGRIGQPQDMVGPVVFLASSLSAYVTGETLVVDGGYLTN